MSKIFRYPLRIVKGENGTDQQMVDMMNKLTKLGYVNEWEGIMTGIEYKSIVTNLNGGNHKMGYIRSNQYEVSKYSESRIKLTVDQESLILEMASICRNDTWQQDECVVYTDHNNNIKSFQTVDAMEGMSLPETPFHRRPTIHELHLKHQLIKTNNMESSKFKSGDRVKITCKMMSSTSSLYSLLGKIGTVCEVDKDNNVQVDLQRATHDKWWFHSGNIELYAQNKIIGYKIKDEKYAKPASQICGVSSFYEDSVGKYDFTINSMCFDRLKEYGVLDLWCDPVEKATTKTLVLGSSRVPIIISNGKIEAESKNFNIKDITRLYHIFLPHHPVSGFDVSVSKIKIGCSEFSKDDLKLIIDTYNDISTSV